MMHSEIVTGMIFSLIDWSRIDDGDDDDSGGESPLVMMMVMMFHRHRSLSQ